MNKKPLVLASLAFALTVSGSALASTSSYWDFLQSGNDTDNHISGQGRINSLGGSKTVDGQKIGLTITGWSSALWGGQTGDDKCGVEKDDKCVVQSKLTRYGGGLGIVNFDENDDTPNHSIDNNQNDFDMILLTFTEAVSISAIDTGWNYSYSNGGFGTNNNDRNKNHANASALAYTGNGVPPAFSTFEEKNPPYKTWQTIANEGWSEIASNASTVKSGSQKGEIPISNNVFSKYWLLGAAHAVANDLGNHISDHIKISGVNFHTQGSGGNTSTPTPVNAPGALLMLVAAGAFLIGRKRQSA